jgi:hypothetical protein
LPARGTDYNITGATLTFGTAPGIVVSPGAVLILYCDGTNVIQLAGLVATSTSAMW